MGTAKRKGNSPPGDLRMAAQGCSQVRWGMGGLLPHLRGSPRRWPRSAVGGGGGSIPVPGPAPGDRGPLLHADTLFLSQLRFISYKHTGRGEASAGEGGAGPPLVKGATCRGTPSHAAGGGAGLSQLHRSGLRGHQVSSIHLKKGLHSQQICRDRCEGEIRPFMGKRTFQMLKTVSRTHIRYHSEETWLRGFGRPNGLKGI